MKRPWLKPILTRLYKPHEETMLLNRCKWNTYSGIWGGPDVAANMCLAAVFIDRITKQKVCGIGSPPCDSYGVS